MELSRSVPGSSLILGVKFESRPFKLLDVVLVLGVVAAVVATGLDDKIEDRTLLGRDEGIPWGRWGALGCDDNSDERRMLLLLQRWDPLGTFRFDLIPYGGCE